MFMTDSALIRELQKSETLDHISVLIVDEAHERSLNTDIVMGIARQLMQMRPSDFFVVVASATIDEQPFLRYFQCKPDRKAVEAQGRLFPVSSDT